MKQLKKQENIVMYDSDEAATIQTVTGWVSGDGFFWGENEHQARWRGCTNIKCKCGNITVKSYTICENCRAKATRERYLALPFREYKGEPVVDWDGETYFFDEDSIIEYLDDNDLTEIDLLFCRKQEWNPVSPDIWEDIMPPDEYELPDELQEALDNLNKVIESLPACSYFPGKERTVYKLVRGDK